MREARRSSVKSLQRWSSSCMCAMVAGLADCCFACPSKNEVQTMLDEGVQPNEITVPMLPCVAPEETLTFWRALGFAVTYEEIKPYLYLAVRLRGFELHYGRASSNVDPSQENTGGCLVMVDTVAPYHAAFTEAMRRTYGKMLAKGLPRITRYRPGASRFTVMDPSGNSIVFIQRDEPTELEYGGSKQLQGLARVLETCGSCASSKTTTAPPSGP